jgi:hypothetical protein
VVIDSCCKLNLLATGREVEIVHALGLVLLDTVHSHLEPIGLWTPPDESGVRGREPVTTSSLREAGLLETRGLDSDALIEAFVRAAERITDVDASCIALAGVLGLPLATDDRKERAVAADLFPGLPVISTLDLLHEAARALRWTDDDLAAVAARVRWRGNFAPPRDDPRRQWYLTLLRRAGA